MAVLYLETNKIKLFNSLSNVIPETRKQELLRIAEKVTGRSQNLWTVEPFTNPPVQKDAHNCGVYVCRAADQIVQNLELDFNKFDAEDFREEIYNRLHTFHTSHLLLLADAESWPDWGSEPVKKNYYLDDAPEMVTDDYKTQRDIDNYVEEKVEERLEGTNFGQLETSATIERKPDYANDPPADLLQNHNLESQLQSGSVTKVILERLVALEQTLSSVQSALAPIAENLQAKAIKDPSLLELNRKLQGATEDALHGQQRINDLRLSLNRLKSVKGFSSLPVDTIVKQYGEWLVFEFNSASPVDSRFRCRHCTGHNQQKPATTSASATTAKTNTSKRSVAFRIRQLRHKRQTESSKDKAQRLAVQEALSKEQQRARQLKTERLAGKVTKTKANRLASAEGLTMREVLKGSKTLDTNSKKRLMNLLNTHPSSPRHSSSYELQKIETFEAIRRNALTTNKIAATNSMMRTAFLIVKKNYAYSGMPDLVMTQIINGARMGIHHYSGKACVEMGLAISDKLHLNLLTVIHSKTAPVSILMDSSTDRQGRQYLIVSVRTVVSHYPKTFFFHLLELNQETGKSLLTDILKMLAEDEDMLVRYNSNLDGFSSHFKNQLVALSTDGASVVAGTFQGFRGLLTSYLDTHQYDRNLYFTHCRAHKLDLALKAVNFPFRHFLQTLYSSVYNVFGTSRMHKNINFLKDSARTLGLRSYAIKTVFPVRWSESELQAVQNLIRMWHPITVTLNFFLETKEARKPKNKKLYQTLASLRYVMTDAKVFLQVHHWQGLLERLTLASKSYQAKDSLITEAHSTLLSLTADLKKPATGSTFADHDKALDDRYGLQCQLSSGWKACSTTELNKFGKPDFTSITSIGLNSTIRTHGKFRKEIGTRFLDGVFRDISVDRNSEIGKELLEQVEMLHFSGTTTLEEENKFSTLATRFKIEIPTTEGERGTTSLLQRAIKYARESEEVVLDDAFSLEAFDVLPPVIQTYLAMQEKDLMYSKFKTDANAAISDELKKRFLDNTVGNVVDSSNPHLFVAMEYNLLMDVLRYGYAKVFKEATYSASEIKRYSRSWFGKGDGVDLKLRGDKTITTTAELATKLSVPAATAVDYIDFLTNLRQNVQSYLQNNPTSPRAEKLSIANLEKNSPQYLWKQLLDLSDKIPDMMTENVKAMILNMLSVPTGTAEIERMFSMLFFSKAERRSKLSRQNLEATLRVRSNTDNNIVNFDATPFSWFWYNNPLQSTCRMLSDDPLDMNRSRMYKFKQYLADVKHNVFEPMKASDFNIDQFDMDREDSLLDTAEDELGGDTLQFLSLTDPAFAESNEVDSINRNIYKQLQG